MAPDREQQLVLGTGQADRLGLILTPVLEPSQAITERQQPLEVVIPQRPHDSTFHIGTR